MCAYRDPGIELAPAHAFCSLNQLGERRRHPSGQRHQDEGDQR